MLSRERIDAEKYVLAKEAEWRQKHQVQSGSPPTQSEGAKVTTAAEAKTRAQRGMEGVEWVGLGAERWQQLLSVYGEPVTGRSGPRQKDTIGSSLLSIWYAL